jgi:hypothetical protein
MNCLKQLYLPNQLKSRVHCTLDRPLLPTQVDIVIDQHHGSTVALEATSERLQASKIKLAPTLSQRIKELSAKNSQLRLEVSYHMQLQDATRPFHNMVRQAVDELEILKATLLEFESIKQQVYKE